MFLIFRKPASGARGGNKVSTVCDRVRSVLLAQEKENDNNRLLPILATLVRDGGQLEVALKKIKTVKGKFICISYSHTPHSKHLEIEQEV